MPTAAKRIPCRELGLLGLLAVLWGSSYLLIKVAVATIPPLTLIAMRVCLAAAFLLALVWLRGARLPKGWRTWRMLLIQAFFNSIASWTLLAWGQRYVESGLAGVLNSTSPIFVFFITLVFTRHEAVTAGRLAGAFAGMFGVALIVGLDALHSIGRQTAAQLAILCAALLYAFSAIYGKRFSSLSPTVTAAGTMLWASACLLPLSLIVDRPWTLNPSLSSVIAAILLGLLGTGVALLLYFRLVRTIGSMGAASQSYLRAAVSVMLGIFVLGEQITWSIAIGLLMVTVGVALINGSAAAPERQERHREQRMGTHHPSIT